MSVPEPKGWSPNHTYTPLNEYTSHPDTKFDDRPSMNPYPKGNPDLNKQFNDTPHLVKMMRKYERLIFIDYKLHENKSVIDYKVFIRNILNFKALNEEMTDKVYQLPYQLQKILDDFGQEEAYAV